MNKFKKMRLVIILVWVILGIALLISANTLGRNIEAQPTILLIVKIYITSIPIGIALQLILKRREDKS